MLLVKSTIYSTVHPYHILLFFTGVVMHTIYGVYGREGTQLTLTICGCHPHTTDTKRTILGDVTPPSSKSPPMFTNPHPTPNPTPNPHPNPNVNPRFCLPT